MCQVLEVSENGYNNWRKRGKSKRKQYDEFHGASVLKMRIITTGVIMGVLVFT
jgi:hypothetical protein